MGSIRVGRPLAAAIVLVCASQGCQGGCSLGQVKPLPAPLPKDQTVEGGVQVRIAPAGFSKLESALPDLLRTAFAPVWENRILRDSSSSTSGVLLMLAACE